LRRANEVKNHGHHALLHIAINKNDPDNHTTFSTRIVNG
jgi:hypothetical protein